MKLVRGRVNIVGVYMKTQMDVAIKIETDDHRDEGGEKTLPKEKRCYDDIGAQRKWHS